MNNTSINLLKKYFLSFFITITISASYFSLKASEYINSIAKISLSTAAGVGIISPIVLYLLHSKISLPYKNIQYPWSNHFTAEKHSINDEHYYHIERTQPIENLHTTNTLFVHLHGFGDHPLALACSQDGTLFPSNDYYAICFEDAAKNTLFKTSFGQTSDVVSILKILLYISKHYTSIHFIAHSRGAAALINTIAILNHPHHELLEKLDIDELERIILLKKIKNGAMLLRAPLVHTKMLLQKSCGTFWSYFLEAFILAPLSGFRYSSHGPQAINSINNFHYLSIPTLICFPEHDQLIDESLNKKFITKYTRINGIENTHTYTYSGDHAGISDKNFEEIAHHFLTYKTNG